MAVGLSHCQLTASSRHSLQLAIVIANCLLAVANLPSASYSIDNCLLAVVLAISWLMPLPIICYLLPLPSAVYCHCQLSAICCHSHQLANAIANCLLAVVLVISWLLSLPIIC